jgi:CRP-like cAMP-binding protein
VHVADLDTSTQVDKAFAGNRLLSAFSTETRAYIDAAATIVELSPGQILFDSGDAVKASIFPFGATSVSLIVDLASGRSVEVASIGREGAVGGIVSCGHAPAFSRAEVQVGGPALRIPMQALEDGKRQSPFIGNLFCRYSDYLLSQLMQSVACNLFHSIEQRAARWLLIAQDRSGDRLKMTQDELAKLLGAQRTTVNAVERTFQEDGLIASRRGSVEVLDRDGLIQRSCGCYDAVEKHFADIIGDHGTGAESAPGCE